MATTTSNLQLTKPEVTDNITPTIFANNFDKIDTAVTARMPKSGGAFTGSVQAATGTTVNSGEVKNIRIVNQAYNAVLGGTRFIDLQRK